MIPPVVPIRLKIEINCREHFTVLGLTKILHKTSNEWFKGQCEVPTYFMEELLGTKLRALYQRKKGRDLFDLYLAFIQGSPNPDQVIQCFREYMTFVVGKPPTRKQFAQNLALKMKDPEFLGDMKGILRTENQYNADEAFELVMEQLIERV